jgi:type IV pilus assembly protein PilV
MNNFAKNSHKKIPISKQAGFSMLEVLIALVIILFGILGAEGVQLSAINNANIAKQKSLAAMVVSNMVARMQGNSKFWAKNTTSYSSLAASSTAPTNACSSVCTPANLAGHDRDVLKNDLFDSGLSGATGNITYVTGSSPASYNISLTWNAKNVDKDSTSAAATSTTTVNYNTSVVIYAGI